MLSSASLRKVSLLLAPLLLACILAVAVFRQRPSAGPENPGQAAAREGGAPRAQEVVAPRAQEFLHARGKNKWSGVVMSSIGVFSGLKIEQGFTRAAFWERRCPIHAIDHGTSADAEVYTAAYNECTGVADVVYYSVDAAKFKEGAGRFPGWKNDPELVKVMKSRGKRNYEYATHTDYPGVGFFSLDRGHQAPVGAFNADEVSAKMTNTPTNLSPQNGYLNKGVWNYLEQEMRAKSAEADDIDDGEKSSFELITGPLYEVPEAFFKSARGKKAWEEMLWSGGEVNQEQPWCNNDAGDDGFRSNPLRNSDGSVGSQKVTCRTGRSKMDRPYDNPNQLSMHYQKSSRSFPLRIPVGYYKLAVLGDDSHYGRHTCPYIMDQAGQCMLVSLDLLLKLAHLDLGDSQFAGLGGMKIRPTNSDHEYSAEVDAEFCLRRGSLIHRKKLCYDATEQTDLTIKTFEDYWRMRG